MSIQIYFEISVFNLWIATTSLFLAYDEVYIYPSFNVFLATFNHEEISKCKFSQSFQTKYK